MMTDDSFYENDGTPGSFNFYKGHEQAVSDIVAERLRQVSDEKWTPQHDDEHADGEIARAAAAYAFSGSLSDKILRERATMWWDKFGSDTLRVVKSLWPWAWEWWKPKDQRRDLVRAGALIVAEIERLDRAAEKKG